MSRCKSLLYEEENIKHGLELIYRIIIFFFSLDELETSCNICRVLLMDLLLTCGGASFFMVFFFFFEFFIFSFKTRYISGVFVF